MNKKLRNILSVGAVTILTASSMLPVHALSNNTHSTNKTCRKVYIYINGVKHEITSNCPTTSTKPEVKPERPSIPSTKPEQKPDNNTGNSDNNNNNNQNNSGSTEEKPSTTPSINNSDFSSYQQQVLELVNIERTKRGLSALTLDSKLSSVATTKSQDMINKNYFDHTSPTYGSPFDMMKKFGISYRTAGENIAKGQRTPQEVMNAWMNSSGHRANILNANFTKLGVGIAKDSNGRLYWTQMFIG